MAAYFVARINVKNPTSLTEYSKRAAPILSKFGGQLLFKGGPDNIFLGDTVLRNLAVFEFPNKDAIEAFYTSAEYQKLISIREEGADMVFSAH